MQQDYDKIAAFKQQSIENQLKIELWERFLGNWKDDNLYSEQDEELRSKTQTRINFWQKKRAASSETAEKTSRIYFEWRRCVEENKSCQVM